MERVIREVWADHFGREVGPHDDFYDLGGDSITVTDIVLLARERGLDVRSSAALRYSTPARLAEHLTIGADGPPKDVPGLRSSAEDVCAQEWNPADVEPAPIVEEGENVPLFVVHSYSHVQAEREAVAGWVRRRPAFGLALPGGNGPVPPMSSLREIGERYAAAIGARLSHGRIRLAGFGPGAAVAVEVARVLARSAEVEQLVLVNPPALDRRPEPLDVVHSRHLDVFARRFGLDGTESATQAHERVDQEHGWYRGCTPPDLARLQLASALFDRLLSEYGPEPYEGPAVLFQDSAVPERTWRPILPRLDVHKLGYGLTSPHAIIGDPALADMIRRTPA
ncbi:phosphopantetheine-binding protein [Nonomuraea sp. NPDC052265]|uniref:phosphopantetheine-binding protein n=1 Tax=Nonomuraea sp. NPDC052265 TaxID=3364374 RepID=UPI0037CA343B